MSNALTTPMSGAVPAHIQKAYAAQQGNAALAAGVSAGYPIISYKGKVWHLVEAGERTLITVGEGRNANDPAASLEAVIVRANPALNKVYYPDGYEEGSTERPLCHSDDGIYPAADAQEKQAVACGACPHNEWGSKISDNGSRGKACADSRRMAISAVDDIGNPMLLRCPAASLKTLLAYGQQLEKRGWPYQALVTRIGFDASLAYPALTFTPERWLDDDELQEVMGMQEDDLVLSITAMRPPSQAAREAVAKAPAPQEDAFSKLEQTMPGAEAPAPGTAGAPLKRKRRTKEQIAADAAAQTPAPAPEPEPQPEPEPVAEQPKRKGFGAGRASAPTQAAPQAQAAPQTQAASNLGDDALAELESVLEGFDDEDEVEED
jgi:hypothetical protein